MVDVDEAVRQSALEGIYIVLAGVSIVCGLITCAFLTIELSWFEVVFFYSTATVLRLAAGTVMNRMGLAETVDTWNNRYHRFVVIVLNAVVGTVLLGRLAWDARLPNPQNIGPLVFLVSAFVLYFIAARFTKPNTFGARVRSATLTVVLIYMMTDIAIGQFSNPWLYAVWVQIWPVMWFASWNRLRTLQRRFGWPNR